MQLYMGTQHAQRVVVQRNTCTEDNPQRVGTSNQWPVQTCMHSSSLINGINASACLNVCERCVYHHYQTGLLYATYMHV